jgi:hypothetical protein
MISSALRLEPLVPVTRSRSWIGACSLLTAPVFGGLMFVLIWTLRHDLAGMLLGRFTLGSILIVSLVMLAVFAGMTFWQSSWAVRLIRDAMQADPRRGYLLLATLLFAAALVSLLAVSMVNLPRFPYSAAQVMLAWLPAALAALGSAIAMSRARANAFLWLGYLLFIPLFSVSIHTLAMENLCGNHSVSGVNVALLSQMQVPWIMIGFAMVVVTMLVVLVKAWRSGALDGWLGMGAMSLGVPLMAFAVLTIGTWAAFSRLSGCADAQVSLVLHHVMGAFYW